MKRTKPDSQSDSPDSTRQTALSPSPSGLGHHPLPSSRQANSSLANSKRNRILNSIHPTNAKDYDASNQIEFEPEPEPEPELELERKQAFNPVKTVSHQIWVAGLSSHPTDPLARSRAVPHPVPAGLTPRQAFPPAIKPILALNTLTIKNILHRPAQLPYSQPCHDPFNPTLAILLDATSAILALPPRSSSLSLSSLSNACQALVRCASPLCESLYCQLRAQLETKATAIRSDFIAGLPSVPAVRALGAAPSSDPNALVALLGGLDERECQQWLVKVQRGWNDWYSQLRFIRSILVHLDRTILVRSDSMLPIWELGLELFRKIVLGSPSDPISLSLSVAFCHQVALERAGRPAGHTLIQALTPLIFTALGSAGFDALVCRPVVKTTECFYSDEGRRLIGEVESGVLSVDGPNGYLAHIVTRLEQESEMVARLFATPDRALNGLLLKTVLQLVESHFVRAHVDALLAHGFVRLLEVYPDPGAAKSLHTLYVLLTNLGQSATQRLRQAFTGWMKRTGSAMLHKAAGGEEAEARRDGAMVEQLIKFKRLMDDVVRLCFEEEWEMMYAIKEAFESFINERQNRPAEMIAKFIDQKMRVSSRAMSEQEMEDCLSQVLVLFRYTDGKDIFEEFYKRDLSRRLLLSKSASIDAERSMVMKLKEECGPGFTAKLEVMFRDMEISNDLNAAYQAQQAQSGPADGPELSVSVLTAGSWPTSYGGETRPVLPSALQAHLERFERFYYAKHLGRRLSWAHLLGHMVVQATFRGSGSGKGAGVAKKELAVSTYQGLVLLLFDEMKDEEQSLSFKEIVQRTGINEKEVNRTLQSLTNGKHKILIKKPKSHHEPIMNPTTTTTTTTTTDTTDTTTGTSIKKDVGNNQGEEENCRWRFGVNEGFKSECYRVRVNQIVQVKESAEDREVTRSKVVTDRQTMIQLTIVRIMKARKKIKHSNLIVEVYEQNRERFKSEVKEIKVGIESLLGREYLERVEGSMDEYRYLA